MASWEIVMNPSNTQARQTIPWLLPLLFVVFLVGPSQARAQSTDTYRDKIFLKNGDQITGTIKELDRGKLRIKTKTMDTVYINWYRSLRRLFHWV